MGIPPLGPPPFQPPKSGNGNQLTPAQIAALTAMYNKILSMAYTGDVQPAEMDAFMRKLTGLINEKPPLDPTIVKELKVLQTAIGTAEMLRKDPVKASKILLDAAQILQTLLGIKK